MCELRLIRRHPAYNKPELLAKEPNEVWSWDITWLRGANRLEKYPLYTVLDIFSRYVVGWMIVEVESSEWAKQLIAETACKQGIQPEQLTLHTDNGIPMKGKPLSQLLVDLHIIQNHSRHASDDNPVSEAHFKTMKYRSDYPNRFASIDAARVWARAFFGWYNNLHYHSGLNLMTPVSVHYRQADLIQQQRQSFMSAVFQACPERFRGGLPSINGAPKAVYINPPNQPEIFLNLFCEVISTSLTHTDF